jgi:hypothetical protein
MRAATLLRRLIPIVLGVGALVFMVRQLRVQEQEIASLRKEIRQLADAEPEVNPRRDCPILCLSSAAAPSPAPAAGAGDSRAEQPPAVAGGAAVSEPEPISPEEQLAHLNAAFSAQSFDHTWGDSQRERVSGLLRELGSTASEVTGVECRDSLCRAQVTLSDEARYAAFMQNLIASPAVRAASEQATFHRSPPAADGRVTISMFLTKPGTELPLLD